MFILNDRSGKWLYIFCNLQNEALEDALIKIHKGS